ncbi:MAG TPA: DUF389 domain-containing protein [Ornithinimicrobium sp.]|uniref:DUF389 domain-containing protein n=1 Tax=Ornithinimicrobium sp. TaxID=1977084 RepID=UPI002B49D3BB|nr:DUF389 domain-containing protein [Ornithinimicrobium sp.]HKJ10752.1 DUF389 domain-containing protein [Ornithinimicrobium sp.]
MAAGSLSDQETVSRLEGQVALTPTFLLYMASSGVLACVALLSNSVPILIGSMILAPLMPALALVPFALAERRRDLAVRGLTVASAGLALAFVVAWLTAALMGAAGVLVSDAVLENPLLQERVHPGWWSMAAAVAAGLAGTVAQANEKTDALIGTVAALALVPAVGATALSVYAGELNTALGGLLLLGLNVGLIIAMGVAGILVSAGRAGWRPLAMLPVVTTLVLAVLLTWAQAEGTVPEQPAHASGPGTITATW